MRIWLGYCRWVLVKTLFCSCNLKMWMSGLFFVITYFFRFYKVSTFSRILNLIILKPLRMSIFINKIRHFCLNRASDSFILVLEDWKHSGTPSPWHAVSKNKSAPDFTAPYRHLIWFKESSWPPIGRAFVLIPYWLRSTEYWHMWLIKSQVTVDSSDKSSVNNHVLHLCLLSLLNYELTKEVDW